MEDKFKTNKPLYDHSISYDTSKLPQELKDYIEKLEEYDKEGNWFDYDIVFDQFEIILKGYIRHKIITDYDFNILLRKYGWYV